MYKILCDICKNEIDTNTTEGAVINIYKIEQMVDFKSGEIDNLKPVNYKYDLCGDCTKKLSDFIKSISKK